MNALNKQKIILASKSPRRKELLSQASIAFDIIPSSVDETKIDERDPEKLVKKLSCLKAMDIAKKYPEKWILGADTIVCLNDLILEKPDSKKDAAKMLITLSNKEHTVFTGFTLCCLSKNRTIIDIVKTKVFFKKLTNNEIKWYLNFNEYADKAGAYAIQGKGAFFIKKISGSYTNVVGLPICEVIECFIKESIIG